MPTRAHPHQLSLTMLAFGAAALPVVLCMPTGSVSAQEVEDEIRRATELAISNSIGEALSESLDRSVAIRDVLAQAADTFYSQGAYGWVALGDDSFDGGPGVDIDFSSDSYRALGGNTFRFSDQIFGGFAVSATNVTTEVETEVDVLGQTIRNEFESTFNFYTLAGNGSYFLFKDDRSRLWANGLYQFTYIDLDSDVIDNSYSNSISPSVSYAMDLEPVDLEFSGGFNYATNSESDDSYTNQQASFKVKREFGDFVPQFLISLTSELGSITDDGSISFRPEVNYRRDNLAFGVGYSTTRQTEDDLIRTNEAFVNFRWRF